MNIFGKFNALNASAAGCVGRALGVNNHSIKKGLEKIPQLPGRIERIDEGQGFSVIVDYAFELYNTIEVLEPNKIIHVLGSTGGGRDVSRRKELGNIAGAKADFIIVTNEDPYDDDPMEIIHDVASGVIEKGAVVEENLFLIEDRFEAIEKAVSLANENDVILITGKGSEQAIAVANGELIAWDDRKTVIKILKNL
jgi:UDP-N-acetylmuramoyl-L-alanyl-D-glutamate--2,6-diaminopimelate ligase